MRFKLTDYYDYYKLPAVCYSLEIYHTPLTFDEYKDVVVSKVKYYSERDGVSWLAVYSTTDSDTAVQTTRRTGKRGRPPKTVQGKKIDGHTHILLVGNSDKSAHSTAYAIKESFDKRYKRKSCQVVSKGDNVHAYNTIAYNMRQADKVRTGGDFDFARYLKEHDFFS